MAVDDLYEVTTSVRTAEGLMQFTFGYKMEVGTIQPTTLAAFALFFAQNRLDVYVPCCSDDLEVDNVTVRAVTNQVDFPGGVNLNNLVGTGMGEALPNNSAAVLRLKTNAPNSKHNGRMYLPGTPENSQADGTMIAAQQTLFNTFGTKLELDIALDPPDNAEFTPVVISRVLNGAPRVPPVGFNLVSALVDISLRQQRKRGGNRL